MTTRNTDSIASGPPTWRRRLLEVLRAVVPPGRAALVGFPNHPNVGDNAIWLGERTLLADVGVRLNYVADAASFSEAALRRAIGEGPVLMHGGGNLGDLYPEHELFRESVLGCLRANPVVVLPQTFYFRDRTALDRAARAVASHPSVAVFLRDEESLARALRAFDVPVYLVPDAVFGLEMTRQESPLDDRTLWLARTDGEGQIPNTPLSWTAKMAIEDWLPRPAVTTSRVARGLEWATGSEPYASGQPSRKALPRRKVPTHLRARLYDHQARFHLERGVAQLSEARLVVTDRLHAHLLCVLLRIEHVVLPDRFGKLLAYLATWTRNQPGVHVARSVVEAERIVRDLRSAGAREV